MPINLQMALKSLVQNRLQALLTLSGMSIGVAMVVLVSGLGLGAQQQIEAQIQSAGPTLITVKAGNFRPPGITTAGEQDSGGGEVSEGAVDGYELGFSEALETNAAVKDARARIQAPKRGTVRSPAWPLTLKEFDLLDQQIADIRLVAGSVAGNITLDETINGSVRIARVYGIQDAWPEIQGWELLNGRLLTSREYENALPSILVSDVVANRLWSIDTAVGQTVKLKDKTLEVVGIIQGDTEEGSALIVPTVYVPLSLAHSLLDRDDLDIINLRTSSVGKTTAVATTIKDQLRLLREIPDDTLDDFRVETQSMSAMPSLGTDPRIARAVHSNIVEFEQEAWEEMALSLRQAGRTFTLLLSAAAAVSLMVGGIGVMNIMLVSVAARTKEIGLRMAMGARVGDVLTQFLVEAVTLAALGGIIGLGLGTLGLMAAEYGFNWATAISPTMLVIAVIMAALTGIIFGYGPARRAANLDPVVALKSE
ncbi:MAG: putative ABC transport system permease protein [Pseudohongiellaceae bacterium]|jgi:putative ABC transport system permease protein